MIKHKRMRWTRHVASTGKKRNSHKILVRKVERQRPLGKTRISEKIMLKSVLKAVGWQGVA
jgi:hypothetical protein